MVADMGDGFASEYHGRPAKIVRAMYGLHVAGALFRSYLAAHLRELGYKLCRADPGVHMRPALKEKEDRYYQYMLACVDDILCCGTDPASQMKMIEGKFTLKYGTVEHPSMYLGADIVEAYVLGDEGKV